MQIVTCRVSEVLAILQKNRKTHRETFEKALEGYRKTVIEHLEQRLKDAKSGRKVNIYIQLEEPQDQTKDYDRAIQMLEMSIDDKVELSQQEFAQLVQDDWSWKEQFTLTNTRYLSS